MEKFGYSIKAKEKLDKITARTHKSIAPPENDDIGIIDEP